MLDPQQHRRQLFDALRPPEGYQLDYAIGTTYSLDLLAMLTVPLAYTFWDSDETQNNLLKDPLALLHGVRQVIDRLAIFCQAGMIKVPRGSQQLFTYLEDAVFEVTPPHKDGVFHPKVWLLRYTPCSTSSSEHEEAPVRYRLLCLSRNLTFDQSWDTMLVLDGVHQAERKVAYGRNHPLGDFMAALPKLTVRPLTAAAEAAIALLSDEVRKVDFELPWPGASLEFMPMGLNGRRSWPFNSWARRQLIISPFITPDFLERMGSQSSQNILISRLESLAPLMPETLTPYQPIYLLDPSAVPEESEEVEASEHMATALSPQTGLHAKLFLCEYGRSDVELFTGSANATGAAFSKNVEFLVKITGKGAQFGIDKLLVGDKKGDKEVRLLDLLKEYQAGEAVEDESEKQKFLEQLASNWQRQVACLPLKAVVLPDPHNSDIAGAIFTIQIQIAGEADGAPLLTLPENVQLWCWPVTRREIEAVPVTLGQSSAAVIQHLSYAGLTSFYAFKLQVTQGDERLATQFVLNLPLVNPPENRREQVLRFLLDNKNKVLNYLLFLLADNEYMLTEIRQVWQQQERVGGQGDGLALPTDLFESLVKALYRDPTKLDHIFSLVTDLQKAGQGGLLPEGFDEIWLPVWQARLMQRRASLEDEPE